MPLFEVFIPTTDPNGFNITARIKADSWIQALRNGLSRLGDTTDVRNVMCDITEQGIDVTEPTSGRVFRIRELPEAEPFKVAAVPTPVVAAPPPVAVAPPPAAKAPTITSAPPPAARRSPGPAPLQAPPPVAIPSPARPVAKPQAKAPDPASLVAKAPEASPPPMAVKPEAQRTEKERAAVVKPKEAVPTPLAFPTDRFNAQVEEETIKEERPVEGPVPQIGRGKVAPTRSIEDIIGELFDTTQKMYDARDYKEAAAFILKLAHQNIPSDSGAVFISDFNRGDLFFASATGPKAKDVMKFRVGMGKGIVGFSAQECVSLAVSDVHRDPRFYAKISDSLGYETRSILCAPAQSEGRVYGAIELINKSTGTSFSSDEINLLNYLAHEFADYLMNTGQPGDIE
jgi:hypothetical protein